MRLIVNQIVRTLIGHEWNLHNWKKFKYVSWMNNERIVG